MASQPTDSSTPASKDELPSIPQAHQPATKIRSGEMMQQPQHRGIQIQNGGSQSQSQSQSGERHAPDQPTEQIDGDGARQADDHAAEHSIDEQAGETETERAGEKVEPAETSKDGVEPGSREAGIAQSGKEDMIDEGDPNSDRYKQYEVNTPQTMPPGSTDENRKREQAEMQERPRIEMDERGYGGASEEREEQSGD